MKDFIGFLLIAIIGISIGNFRINSENRAKDEVVKVKQEKIEREKEAERQELKKKEVKAERIKIDENREKILIKKDYGKFTYKTYKNDKFGFSIKYPTFLENEEKGLEGEGINLWDKDERVRLTAWGENNLEGLSLNSILQNDIRRLDVKYYKKIQKDYYVLSWEDNEKVYYKRCMVGKGAINTFLIEYPKVDKEKLNKIVDEIYGSFKPGELSKKK